MSLAPGRIPCPRILISAASSGSGKTILSLGLLAALRRRGLSVAAAKVGPDFIDCAHLSRAAGSPARNLDAFLAPSAHVVSSFVRGAHESEVCVIEGVMGLFDGRHGTGEGSSAHIARLLQVPVVAVLDCARASATAGAVALGLRRFDPSVNVAGVILNRVASDRHAATIRDACRSAGVEVFGVIARDERLALPSRHLGLTSPQSPGWDEAVQAAADAIERGVDLDALLAIARSAPPLPAHAALVAREPQVRIAVPHDEAFWFYDHATLDALRDAGATIVNYSPLRDPFPDVDAAFIGGGYPELHAGALAANTEARNGLRDATAAGMPVYAECGGLMYLAQTLEVGEQRAPMAGAIDATATMCDRRTALRYVEADVLADGPLFAAGERVRGHEFHYSRISYARPSYAYAYDTLQEGYVCGNVHASYVHVHLGAHPGAIERFVQHARGDTV